MLHRIRDTCLQARTTGWRTGWRTYASALLLGGLGLAASAQVATYDPSSGLLSIPAVRVGSAAYTQVTLRDKGGYVFELQSATDQKPAAPQLASYDAASRLLVLPAVRVGGTTYLDVQLVDQGSYVFTLQSATAQPDSVTAELAKFAADLEAQFANGAPASGAARLSLVDACWRSNGTTRSYSIADFDANLASIQQRDAYTVGRKIRNMQLLSLRQQSFADGTQRRELQVSYDLVYRDGSVHRGERQTLITGTSAGTPGCTTPENSSRLRALGNQQLLAVAVRANNTRDQRYAVANGNTLTPAVNYRREVQFQITDPMGNATYVIVTGPGPTLTLGSQVLPFSMKFLSPRLLQSAPELQGRNGNFLNWQSSDGFRNCRRPTGDVPVASIVDCAINGATSNSWGWTTSTPNAAADFGFLSQGWEAGATYRFDVYNDDGWKTVNGQAGKAPIGTYYAALDRLPFSFVEMEGKYPLINLGANTPALLAANARSATPANLALSWNLPTALPDGRVYPLYQVWGFHQGSKIGNPTGSFNPAYRVLTRAYPGSTATSTSAFPVTPRLPDQSSKSYDEYNLFFAEPGSFNSIQSRVSLQ